MPAPQPAPPPRVEPPAERIVQRADIVGLADAAADAAASGAQLPATATGLVGKRFELVLPFGCDGPTPEGSSASLQWRYDAAASALRIKAVPTAWAKAEWWQTPPDTVEAMEGFWIERPWSSSTACPAAPAISTAPGSDAFTLPGQTLGIVQLIGAGASRQLVRDGKPYEAVVRVAPDAVNLSQGLRLHLAGRIGGFPDGQPTRCVQSGGREQRPVCLVAAAIEKIEIRNPASGETLAVWEPTADARADVRPDE
ncbi:hypothetical protein [Sphingomonas jatrophae]|nr:hypothetical protein [Sphingomonas jatrophae]